MMKGYKIKYAKFAALGTFLVFGLMLWYLILTYIAGVVEKVQLKNELTEQVAFSNNWEENYNQLVEYKAELEAGIQLLNKNRLDSDQAYLLVDAIYQFSERAFVQVQRIDPQDFNTSSGKIYQTIEMELNGRYHAIAAFINKLENSPFPLIIQEIEINRTINSELTAEVSVIVEYSGE